MTLSELLPSVGRCGEPVVEPTLWPRGTRLGDGGDLVVGGVPVSMVAARFGTPCQVLVEDEVRWRGRTLRAALPDAEIFFGGRALPSRPVYRWMLDEGLSLDVCSAGELAIARAVGFPAERIVLHSKAKPPDGLAAALAYGVGRIVVESPDEIDRLGELAPVGQQVLVRVTPGIDGQNVGLSLAAGAASDAVRRVLAKPNLRFAGLHCRLGAQLRRVTTFEWAARALLEFAAELRACPGAEVAQLTFGGGFAVPTMAEVSEFDLSGLAHRVLGTVSRECANRNLAVPRLAFEPGRCLVATAGVALHRVCTVDRGDRIVAVDGGMACDPHSGVGDTRSAARMVGRRSEAPRRPMTLVGHRDGHVIAEEVTLPIDLRAGDVLAVPSTSVCRHPLASNGDPVCPSPRVGVRDGAVHPLVPWDRSLPQCEGPTLMLATS